MDKEIKGFVQKSAATAGGVANGNLQQPLSVGIEAFKQGFLFFGGAFFIGNIIGVYNLEVVFFIGTKFANCVFDNVFGDVTRRIKNAVLFAFGLCFVYVLPLQLDRKSVV